jgi:hypothetical protein
LAGEIDTAFAKLVEQRAGALHLAADAFFNTRKEQSRHRSVDTLRGYVRDAELFKDHAGAGLL